MVLERVSSDKSSGIVILVNIDSCETTQLHIKINKKRSVVCSIIH